MDSSEKEWKAAKEYVFKVGNGGIEMEFCEEDVLDAFLAGSEWQKKQKE